MELQDYTVLVMLLVLIYMDVVKYFNHSTDGHDESSGKPKYPQNNLENHLPFPPLPHASPAKDQLRH